MRKFIRKRKIMIFKKWTYLMLFLISHHMNQVKCNGSKLCLHPFYPCFYLDCIYLTNINHTTTRFELFECEKGTIFDENKQKCIITSTTAHCNEDFTRHLNLATLNMNKQIIELQQSLVNDLIVRVKIRDNNNTRIKRFFHTNSTNSKSTSTQALTQFYQVILKLGETLDYLPVKSGNINSYNTQTNDINVTLISDNRANLNFKFQNFLYENDANQSHFNTNVENLNLTIELDKSGNKNKQGQYYGFLVIPVKFNETQIVPKKPKIKLNNSGTARLMIKEEDENYKRIESLFKYKKVCYFTNWSQYRPKNGYFTPEHIDPHLCTHIIYAFAYIDNITLTLRTIEKNDEDFYKRINDLKLKNPKLKTMLGVGGWNHPSKEFSDMVRDERSRMVFIYHAIKFIRYYGFDGIDLDWEYPADRGGIPEDKERFTLLLKEFRHAIDNETLLDKNDKLIMSAAVAAGKERIEKAYEISKIAPYLDFLNLMTFDFHGSWDDKTGLNAPLYSSEFETSNASNLNQDWAVNYWISNGFPSHKIVLGLPTYGRTFTLKNENETYLGAKAVGDGLAGDYTKTPGFLSFYECCSLRKNTDWSTVWQSNSKSYYMFRKNQWVSFDDVQSYRLRTAYVVAKKLGGMFIFSIDMDDFTGEFCDMGRYPLLKNSMSLLMEYMPEYYASTIMLKDKHVHDLNLNNTSNVHTTWSVNMTTTTTTTATKISLNKTNNLIKNDLLSLLRQYNNLNKNCTNC